LGPSDEDVLHSAAVKVSKSHVAHAEFLLITVDEIISHLQENADWKLDGIEFIRNQPVVGGKNLGTVWLFQFLADLIPRRHLRPAAAKPALFRRSSQYQLLLSGQSISKFLKGSIEIPIATQKELESIEAGAVSRSRIMFLSRGDKCREEPKFCTFTSS
jgi:hypothetical protein